MAGGVLINVWVLGFALVVLAGLNPPLSILGLTLATASTHVALHAELAWLVDPAVVWMGTGVLALQFLADLYFVPATVKDRAYIHPARIVNAYLHARFQSLIRPLAAALVLAALPVGLPAQSAAVLGFVCGTAIYWLTAWVREHVAMRRGSLVLLLVETAKNVVGLLVALVAGLSAPLALGLLGSLLIPMALWAARLRRDQLLYPAYGGGSASKDT